MVFCLFAPLCENRWINVMAHYTLSQTFSAPMPFLFGCEWSPSNSSFPERVMVSRKAAVGMGNTFEKTRRCSAKCQPNGKKYPNNKAEINLSSNGDI